MEPNLSFENSKYWYFVIQICQNTIFFVLKRLILLKDYDYCHKITIFVLNK